MISCIIKPSEILFISINLSLSFFHLSVKIIYLQKILYVDIISSVARTPIGIKLLSWLRSDYSQSNLNC